MTSPTKKPCRFKHCESHCICGEAVMRLAPGAPVRDEQGRVLFDVCGAPAVHSAAGYPTAFCERHAEARRQRRANMVPTQPVGGRGGARALYGAK